MYNFSYHKARDRDDILELMHSYPFAFVTGCDANNQPVATQVPVIFELHDGELILYGHFMRNTDHHLALAHNPSALLVFTGASSYVSASWYTDPHKGSTWNYRSVHARGNMRFLEGDGAIEVMRKLTLRFEGQHSESPTIYDNLPDSYRIPMMKGIAAFELRVQQLDTVFKLSQDRDEASYCNIVQKLRAQGGNAALVADEMEKRANRR